MKTGCQPVAKTIETGKLLPKAITSSHPSEITVKYQQKAHDGYLMDNHDRKCMWQEMRQWNMNWSSEGRNTNEVQKVPETNRTGQSQEALTKGNQSKLMKQWGVNKLCSDVQL